MSQVQTWFGDVATCVGGVLFTGDFALLREVFIFSSLSTLYMVDSDAIYLPLSASFGTICDSVKSLYSGLFKVLIISFLSSFVILFLGVGLVINGLWSFFISPSLVHLWYVLSLIFNTSHAGFNLAPASLASLISSTAIFRSWVLISLPRVPPRWIGPFF